MPPLQGQSSTSTAIRVLAAVVRQGDSYLVCQRPAEKRHGGLWEFPGGKCESGESDEDAVRRELREELGVRVSAVGHELFSIRDDGAPFMVAFVPVVIEGAPTCHEHTALAWALLDDLMLLPLAPSDQRFAEHLRAHPEARQGR